MAQKTISWVSYITIIGWIIAIVSYNGSAEKSSLARFHLRQSLGLIITAVAIYFATIIFSLMIGFLGTVLSILNLGFLVLWIIGLISAVNGEEKPLPIVGEFYQKTFTFIN
jgi:uncharacterized membrane protein